MNLNEKVERFSKAIELKKKGDKIRAEHHEVLIDLFTNNIEEVSFMDIKIFDEVFLKYNDIQSYILQNESYLNDYLSDKLNREIKYIDHKEEFVLATAFRFAILSIDNSAITKSSKARELFKEAYNIISDKYNKIKIKSNNCTIEVDMTSQSDVNDLKKLMLKYYKEQQELRDQFKENNIKYAKLQETCRDMKAEMKHIVTNINEQNKANFIASMKKFMDLMPTSKISNGNEVLMLSYKKKEEVESPELFIEFSEEE